MSAAEVYATLRQRGSVTISADEVGLLSGVRRLAKADGYAVSQFRERTRSLSSAQKRQRPYHLDLTLPGSDLIVAPDAGGTS